MNTPSIKHLLPLGAYCCATSALATGTKGWKLANKMAKTVSYIPWEKAMKHACLEEYQQIASPLRVLPSSCSAEEAWGAAMLPREAPVQGCQSSMLPSDRPAANIACSA